MSEAELREVGKAVVTFYSNDDDMWTMSLTGGCNPVKVDDEGEPDPDLMAQYAIDNYKMAMLMADAIMNLKKKIAIVDMYLKSKEDLVKFHNEFVKGKQKKQSDVDKYQQPLPGMEDT